MTALPQLPSIRVYTCKKCTSSYVISENDPYISLLKKTMRCPNSVACAGQIKIYATTNIRVANTLKVSALHLYQASLGAGLPNEKRCSPKDLRRLMMGATITDLEVTASPDPQRSIITSITLSIGKMVHLSASTKGATIYKVTEAKDGR